MTFFNHVTFSPISLHDVFKNKTLVVGSVSGHPRRVFRVGLLLSLLERAYYFANNISYFIFPSNRAGHLLLRAVYVCESLAECGEND